MKIVGAGVLATLTLFMLTSSQIENVFSQTEGTSVDNVTSINQTQ